MARGKGPKDNGTLPLFEWADSAAAKLALLTDDVCRAARAITSGALTLLLPMWLTVLLTVDSDSGLRQVLGPATAVAFVCFASAWSVRGLRSRVARKTAVFMQVVAFSGAVAALGIVIYSGFKYENEVRTVWNDAAERRRAAKLAADERRRNEQELAKKADQRCQKNRSEGIERAKKANWSARQALEECRAKFNGQVIQLQTFAQYCGSAQVKFENAKSVLNAANSAVCSTASTK